MRTFPQCPPKLQVKPLTQRSFLNSRDRLSALPLIATKNCDSLSCTTLPSSPAPPVVCLHPTAWTPLHSKQRQQQETKAQLEAMSSARPAGSAAAAREGRFSAVLTQTSRLSATEILRVPFQFNIYRRFKIK